MMSRQFVIIIVFFCFFLGSLSEAQNISQSYIRWYKPKIESSRKPHRFRAVLSGKTSPGTQIEIASDEISILTHAENIEVIGANEIMSEKSVNADKNGNFFLNLEMPLGIVQLPIEVKFSVAESKLYQINIAPPPVAAGSDSLNPGILASHQDLPHFLSKREVWGGIGMNFLRYNQESKDIPSNLTLESIDGPTIYAKFVRSLNSEWAFQTTFNRWPGETNSSAAVQLSEGSYAWTCLSGDFTYVDPQWRRTYKKFASELGLQMGLQYHQAPFLSRSSTTEPDIASIESNAFFMGAFGGLWRLHFDREWMIEAFLRYQHPFSFRNELKVRPDLAFDGSLGLVYHWMENWRFGMFWYGQYQKYDFTGFTDRYFQSTGNRSSSVDGTQSFLFSNLEARLGWEFD
jgi:hypothetical protein